MINTLMVWILLCQTYSSAKRMILSDYNEFHETFEPFIRSIDNENEWRNILTQTHGEVMHCGPTHWEQRQSQRVRHGHGVTADQIPHSGGQKREINYATERTFVKNCPESGPFISVERAFKDKIHQMDMIGIAGSGFYFMKYEIGTMKQTVVYEKLIGGESGWERTESWREVEDYVRNGKSIRRSFKYEIWTAKGEWKTSNQRQWKLKLEKFTDWKLMKLINDHDCLM